MLNAATLILKNAKVFTVNPQHPFVQAVAVRGDRIIAIGCDADMKDFTGKSTRVIDCDGAFVCPGFNDAHLHFIPGGKKLLGLDVGGIRSKQKVLEKVREFVERAKPEQWIVGRGWDESLWEDAAAAGGGGALPTRWDLDRVAPLNPVVLYRADGHSLWANSLAMQFNDVTAATQPPAGGEIERDEKGEPTGVFKETATSLIQVRGGKPPQEAAPAEALTRAMQEAARLGITSVQDGSADYAVFEEFAREDKWTVRMYAWGQLDGNLPRWKEIRQRWARFKPTLQLGCLKGFTDGSLDSATAAMLTPYVSNPNTRGQLLFTQEELNRRVTEAEREGFQVNLHAIGDAALRLALNAFAAAQKAHGQRDTRGRIEHVQFTHPDDLPRFKPLGVIASVQPCHVMTDMRFAELRVGRGPCERGGYLWKSFVRRGVPLAMGTDWPVEPLDVMPNLYAAVTRQNLDGEPQGGWYPQERLTMAEALTAYTLGSAYATFEENIKGSIEVGKLADMVVLDRDLLSAAPKDVLKTKVLYTIFGGKVVYEGY
ncbi:MAG: amidohydrolase [Abditibacteriales bacterium]|nr:amidohydrolase [Abditibacteriales bacterium]MDW8364553.1 amidohydrolase [Abditibacteriales bacterium]